MKYLLSSYSSAVVLPALAMASGLLRGAHGANLRRVSSTAQRSLQGNSCNVHSESLLQIPGEPDIEGGDEQYFCNENGSLKRLNLDQSQVQGLLDLAASGEVTFGESDIDIGGATVEPDGSISVPPGHAISAAATQGNNNNSHNPFSRRLQTGTGTKYFVLFRVTSSSGEVYSHSAMTMSENLFGTNDADSINLKSQMEACSVGKYIVQPGGKPGYDLSPLMSAPGVIDITIPITLDNPRSTVRDAARDEAERKLGEHFGLATTTILTTYMDHALFSLKSCLQECGWAAYASAPGYYQFYQGGYYAQAGVQLHEHGHNMQLAHSGGLDGQTYTDHTCALGNPLYGDDLGRMCFNPAKIWQLQFYPHSTYVKSGWYANEDFAVVDTLQGAQTFKMIGIGEYNLQGDGANRKKVGLQIANGSTRPQYVAFNSAKGANSQNDEADNLVTIVEKTGTLYAVSSLKGYIGAGQTFTTTEGRIVEAQCINTAVTPSLACVCVRESSQTCPNDCVCEDAVCTENGDCGGDTPFCNTSSGACVACLENTDCSGNPSGSICSAGQCVDCIFNSDCDFCSGETCQSSQCVAGPAPCQADTCNPNRTCNALTSTCDDGDAVTGCCMDDNQCTNSDFPACVSNECKECGTASDCDAPTAACEQSTCSDNTCGTEPIIGCCVDNTDCAVAGEFCSASSSTCASCSIYNGDKFGCEANPTNCSWSNQEKTCSPSDGSGGGGGGSGGCTLGDKGASCSVNGDCCSDFCKNNGTCN